MCCIFVLNGVSDIIKFDVIWLIPKLKQNCEKKAQIIHLKATNSAVKRISQKNYQLCFVRFATYVTDISYTIH